MRMSQTEFAELTRKNPSILNNIKNTDIWSFLNNNTKTKATKYKNKKVYCYENGYVSYQEKFDNYGKIIDKFDSVKEYERYLELSLLQRSNEITKLQKQVPFVIQEAFIDNNGKKVKPIIYKADFTYEIAGIGVVVEDVKPFDQQKQKYRTTKDFNLKWKMLQKKYNTFTFQLY